MDRARQLTLRNLALTAVVLIVCVVLAYVASWVVVEVLYQPKGTYVGRLGPREHQALRRGLFANYTNIAVWVGLAVSQTVFLVWHLEPTTQAGGAAGVSVVRRDRPGGV